MKKNEENANLIWKSRDLQMYSYFDRSHEGRFTSKF